MELFIAIVVLIATVGAIYIHTNFGKRYYKVRDQ
jgi:hypothetical protein